MKKRMCFYIFSAAPNRMILSTAGWKLQKKTKKNKTKKAGIHATVLIHAASATATYENAHIGSCRTHSAIDRQASCGIHQ